MVRPRPQDKALFSLKPLRAGGSVNDGSRNRRVGRLGRPLADEPSSQRLDVVCVRRHHLLLSRVEVARYPHAHRGGDRDGGEPTVRCLVGYRSEWTTRASARSARYPDHRPSVADRSIAPSLDDESKHASSGHTQLVARLDHEPVGAGCTGLASDCAGACVEADSSWETTREHSEPQRPDPSQRPHPRAVRAADPSGLEPRRREREPRADGDRKTDVRRAAVAVADHDPHAVAAG
jgi:hypothetical protein